MSSFLLGGASEWQFWHLMWWGWWGTTNGRRSSGDALATQAAKSCPTDVPCWQRCKLFWWTWSGVHSSLKLTSFYELVKWIIFAANLSSYVTVSFPLFPAFEIPTLQCKLAFRPRQVQWPSETSWIKEAQKKEVER